MKTREVSIVILAIVTSLARLRADALADSTSIDQKPPATYSNQQQQSQPLAPARQRKQMSCFVCSTMDYENSADNPCRTITKPSLYRQQPAGGIHQQPVGSSHHPASMDFHHQPTSSSSSSSISSSTTSSISSSTTSSGSSSSSGGGGDVETTSLVTGETMAAPQTSTSQAESSSTSNLGDNLGQSSTTSSYYQPQQISEPTSTAAVAADGSTSTTIPYQINQNTVSSPPQPPPPPVVVDHYGYQQRLPQNTIIKSRPCFEGENFCSIVSVVRIEFVNDTLVSRFWAMERNCSKSCNTGCMLIGERVRLRVCSQCCRTPDCNIGSSATSSLNSHHHNNLATLWLTVAAATTALISLSFAKKDPLT